MRLSLALLTCFAIVVALTTAVKASETDHYRCRRAAAPPTLDGALDEACWSSAQIALVRRRLTDDTPAPPPAAFRMVWDDTHLYFAAQVRDTTPLCTRTQRDQRVWTDDCFELYLSPDRHADRYYELDFNSEGIAWDSLWLPFETGRRTLPAWTAPSLQTKTQQSGDTWTLEGRIAFADLHGTWQNPPIHGDTWAMGVNYLDQQPDVHREDVYVWQNTDNIAAPAQFGSLLFIDTVAHDQTLAQRDSANQLLTTGTLDNADSLARHFPTISISCPTFPVWKLGEEGRRFRRGFGRLQIDKDADGNLTDILETSPFSGDETTHITFPAYRAGRLIIMARHTERGMRRISRGESDGVWLNLAAGDQPLPTMRITDNTWRAVVTTVAVGDPITIDVSPGPAHNMSSDMIQMRIAIAPAPGPGPGSDTTWQATAGGDRIRTDNTPYRPSGKAIRIDAAHRYAGMEKSITHDPATKLYKVSGWIRSDLSPSTFAHVGLDYIREDGKMERQATTRISLDGHLRWGLCNVTGSRAWRRYVGYAYDIPPETHAVRLWFGVNAWENPAATGAVWFDDVAVEPVEPDPQHTMRFAPTTWQGKPHNYTAAQRTRGFAITAPSFLAYHLPDMPPQSATDPASLTSIALADSPQPATVIVHALRDLENVTLEVTDLTSESGQVINLDNTHVGIVRYHQRHRHKLSYEYLLSPNHIEPAAPVNIKADTAQQWWLTSTLLSPGKYTGNIRILVPGQPPVTLPWHIHVAATQPDSIADKWLGMYSYYLNNDSREKIVRDMADMKAHGMTTTFSFNPGIQIPIDSSDRNNPRVMWNDDNHLAATFEIYKQTGFTEPLLLIEPGAFYDAAIEFGGPLGSDGFARVYKVMFNQLKAEHEKRGWLPFIVAPYDEGYPYPFTDHRFERTRVCGQLLKDMGFTIATHSVNLPTDGAARLNKQYASMMDMILLTWCFPPVTVSGVFDGYQTWRDYLGAMHTQGKKMLVYNVDVSGLHPEAMRFSYGLGLWLLKADGIIDWHYHEHSPRVSPYKIWRRQGYTNMNFIYTPRDGHLGGPTLGWEATREGAKDLALLQTLDRLLETTDKAQASRIRAELNQWLIGVDFTRLNSEAALALPGFWDEETYDANDIPIVGGRYKIPNGLSLEDYDAFRLWVCYTIDALKVQQVTH